MSKPILLGVMCLSFECPVEPQTPCEQECSQESLMAGSTVPFPVPLFLLPGYGGTDSLPIPVPQFPPIGPLPPLPPLHPIPPPNPPFEPPPGEPEHPQQPIPEPGTFSVAAVLGLIGLIYSRRKHAQ